MDSSIPLIASLITGTAALVTKYLFDTISTKAENKEINEEVDKVVKIIEERGDDDVLTLMIKNVAELREYYVINKQQARNSFSSALIICILGFIIFSGGIFLSYTSHATQNVIPYSTIGGTIVEIISGLFFWLYSKAITQINLFHNSLLSTEKFLTAIQLAEKVSVEKRDEVYKDIIDKIISYNFTSLKNEKGNTEIK